jgi:hypothetical protein
LCLPGVRGGKTLPLLSSQTQSTWPNSESRRKTVFPPCLVCSVRRTRQRGKSNSRAICSGARVRCWHILRHGNCKARCRLLRVARKTFAQAEFFSVDPSRTSLIKTKFFVGAIGRDGCCLLSLQNQVVDIELNNRARRSEIPQRLDNRAQVRDIVRLLSALRLIFRFLIEALKHLAYAFATFVADDVKHVRLASGHLRIWMAIFAPYGITLG